MELVCPDIDRVCMAVRVIRPPNVPIEIYAYEVRAVLKDNLRGCLDPGASADEKNGGDGNECS